MEINYDLSKYNSKAKQLEQRINNTRTTQQLFDIANEAAALHRELATEMMRSNNNREQLTRIGQRLSGVEQAATHKYYQNDNAGPIASVL